jgi:hypothetical protein
MSLMIITELLILFVQVSLDLALLWLMGRTPFATSLYPVVVSCLEETYICIVAIELCCKGSALALLIVSYAIDCDQNIITIELQTSHNLFEM